MNIETKTIGELIDGLITTSLAIWHLIDKVVAGTATLEEAQQVQLSNQVRSELISAINKRLGERSITRKIHG